MPHLDGRQLQAALLRESDARPIIFISGTDDVPTAVAALKAGAIDFLSKPITEQALLRAINIAVEQETKSGQQRAQLTATSRKLARLTPREAEVLRYVIAGHPNKKIAWHLGTTEKTIKVHRSRVMGKMGSVSSLILSNWLSSPGSNPITIKTVNRRLVTARFNLRSWSKGDV